MPIMSKLRSLRQAIESYVRLGYVEDPISKTSTKERLSEECGGSLARSS